MKLFPAAKHTRFAQLRPGELFILLGERHQYFALKTAPSDGSSFMVLLGPFPEGMNESVLADEEAVPVLSLGTEFSVLLPTDPTVWTREGPSRQPVCLALSGETAYVCTNASRSADSYHACVVNLATGELAQNPPGRPIFTNHWEIALERPNQPATRILRFPLA